eukprot:TRINITY_DN1351_c1_g6_i2.p1 TRINITY_DN1351_c1_g6~~TRINITY_DN1351_c1_g6_i2.p1  ORF type:complete len:2041 (+),score=547.22 TRINITY_DN1351_c1_g6_i2:96-6218(+)
MGQVGSLGRMSKKGQIAPVGAPGAGVVSTQRMPERAAPVVGKRYPTYMYTTLIASFPAACMMVFTIVPFFLACVSLFSTDVMNFDTLLESFEISDHSTVRKRDVTLAAESDWNRILEAYTYKLETGLKETETQATPRKQSLPWKRVYIQFKVQVDNKDMVTECATSEQKAADFRNQFNLLDREDYLRFIKQVEQRIRILPLFQGVCFKSNRKNGQKMRDEPPCTPFTSFAQYYFPGDIRSDYYPANPKEWRLFWNFEYSVLQQGPGNTKVDRDVFQVDTQDILKLFKQNPSWNWFTDASSEEDTSLLLRTQIIIGRPFVIDGKIVTSERDAEQYLNRFYSYLTSYLDTVVGVTADGNPQYTQKDLDRLWVTNVPRNLQVTYGGDGIIESKLHTAMDKDFWYVFMSVIIVLVAAWFYTHSFFIATMSIFQLTLTYFTGTFIHFRSRDEPLSLLTLLSFYVLMSVSLNGVVVFFNTFRQSAFMETNGRKNTLNVPQRLAFCFRKSGAGVTISHLTAGVAFIMNAISPVPAIRDNGVFMLWLMIINIYMFLTFFPCVLILHHYHISRRRRNTQRRKEIMLRRKHLHHPPILRQALRTLDTVSRRANDMPTMYTATEEPPMQMPPTESEADKMRVTFGEANGRFGLGKLTAKLRSTKKPKTTEELIAEQEATFEQFTGAMTRPQRCRRKQPYSSIIQIPVQYTALETGIPKSVTAPAQSDTFEGQVSLAEYRDKHRMHWDEEAKNMHVSTYLGENVFIDPSSQRRLDGVKKLPMIAQVICESGTELRHVTSGVEWDVPPERQEQPDDADADTSLPAQGGAIAVSNAIPQNNVDEEVDVNGFREVPLGNAPEVLGKQTNRSKVAKCCTDMSNCCTLFSDWWTRRGQVKRRFGRFGKRVGETREEKDRRIMSKREKHEGYTGLERLFYNVYTPFLSAAYPFILAGYLLKLLLFIILVLANLDATSKPPQLLSYQSTYEKFQEVTDLFPIKGTCDYCGPYHRPYNEFPPPFGRGSPHGTTRDADRQAYPTCGSRMFNMEDTCGVCGGNNECVDCMGQESFCKSYKTGETCQSDTRCSWVQSQYCIDKPVACPNNPGKQYVAGWVIDDCGTCYLPTYEDQEVMVTIDTGCEATYVPSKNRCKDTTISCGSQPKVGDCNMCYLQGVAGSDEKYLYPAPTGTPGQPGYKRNCVVLCNDTTCPPSRGTCDIITGECVCHSDYVNGFFAHTDGNEYDPDLGKSGDCGKCADGFMPVDAAGQQFFPAGTALCSNDCIEDTFTPADAGTNSTNDTCRCKCNTDHSFVPTPTIGRCMCQLCERYTEFVEPGNTTVTLTKMPGVPRGDSPLWTDKIAGVGGNCTFKQRSRCDHGTLDELTGECVCDTDFDDGMFCKYEVACNKRGKKVDGVCVCIGCWGGADCSKNSCWNSGMCPEMWQQPDPLQVTCQCLGGVWEGVDCSECPTGCQTHSHCPLNWPVSLKGTDLNMVPSKYVECRGSTSGHQCFGDWEGPTCDSCNFPASVPQELINTGQVMCDAKGEIMGCDDVPATDTHFKWLDNCGVCTNVLDGIDKNGHLNNKCNDCPDGEVADSCGVCGGTGHCECQFPQGGEPAQPDMVDFVVGLKPESGVNIHKNAWGYHEDGTSTLMSESIPRVTTFSFRYSQYWLRETCASLLTGENGGLYVDQTYSSECVMYDWVKYLQTHVLVTNSSTGLPIEARACGDGGCQSLPQKQGQIITQLTFPCELQWVDWLAYQFMASQNKEEYIGFTGADPARIQDASHPLKVAWVRLRFRLPDFVQKGERVRDTYYLWEKYLKSISETDAGKSGVLGNPFQWSARWVKYFTEQQARSGTLYAIGLGGAAFAAIAIVFSCSLTLMILSTVSGMGIVILTMSYMKLAGWELGPAEQVGLTILVGIAAEYTVHILEGYLEYIHATQSSLLARETTREAAVAGALQRTGVPIAFSCATILVASCMILMCEILIYRRIAQIMIMVTLISSFHSLCIFPCYLLFLGPVTVLRNWNIRLLWAITVGLCVCFTLSILYLLGTAKDPAGNNLF